MGMDARATLFFGFCIPDGSDTRQMLRDGNWEERYTKAVGIDPDSLSYQDRRNVIIASGCRIVRHVCSDDPQYAVAINDSITTAEWDAPVNASPKAIGDRCAAILSEFCRVMGIPWQEPAWWLCAYWG